MAIDTVGSRSGPGSERGTVLIVDDEPHLVGMYAAMLEDDYTVQTATSGELALEQLTDETDIILLDRRMPGLSGDRVLEVIRAEGYDCRVAMVTSIDPDLDIVEMRFDAYVVKPVRHQDLNELVETLILRTKYSSGIQELYRLASKLVALERQYDEETLASNEEYQALHRRKERLEAATDERMDELIERGDSGLVYRDVLGEITTQ